MSSHEHCVLVEAHTGLVYAVFVRYFAAREDLKDDLIQEGNVGLLLAARTYDASKGAFSTMAWPRIRGAMLDYLRGPRRVGTVPSMVSLDALTEDGGHAFAEPRATFEDGLLARLNVDELRRLIEQQSDGDLVLRWIDGETCAEMATEYGVTGSRINQRVRRVLDRLAERTAVQAAA